MIIIAPRWALEQVEKEKCRINGYEPNPANIDVWIDNPDGWQHYHTWAMSIVAQRPYPELLDQTEGHELLHMAETLWDDLQRNELGGFQGANRPFYIYHEFRRVIEKFSKRDTGLNWSKNQLDAHPDRPK